MKDILPEKEVHVIEEILEAQLDVKTEQLIPEARLMDDLGADSLDVVEITMALEDRLNLAIPDERWERVRTVADIYESVAELLQEQRRP